MLCRSSFEMGLVVHSEARFCMKGLISRMSRRPGEREDFHGIRNSKEPDHPVRSTNTASTSLSVAFCSVCLDENDDAGMLL